MKLQNQKTRWQRREHYTHQSHPNRPESWCLRCVDVTPVEARLRSGADVITSASIWDRFVSKYVSSDWHKMEETLVAPAGLINEKMVKLRLPRLESCLCSCEPRAGMPATVEHRFVYTRKYKPENANHETAVAPARIIVNILKHW